MNRSGPPSSSDNVDELIKLVREELRQRQMSDAELAQCFAPVKKERPLDASMDPAGRVLQLETEKAALEKRAQDAEQEQAVLTHQVCIVSAQFSGSACTSYACSITDRRLSVRSLCFGCRSASSAAGEARAAIQNQRERAV